MAATMPALDTERIRDANIRYHDAAARGYDCKWAIDYGEIGARQVLGKLSKALGRPPGRYARALEIGAGTGYFSLNLLQQGVIGEAVATDISPEMLERLGGVVEPAWRRIMRAAPRISSGSAGPAEDTYNSLEGLVDVHTFTQAALQALAHDAGFTDVRVSGEELLANVYGWFLRRLESDVEPATVPYAWHRFAFGSYLALQWVDGKLLEPRLPASLFYNLLVSARRP
jgi:SAM-dependent methyltransferase